MTGSPSHNAPQLSLVSHSPEQTQHLGELLGRLAREGDVFLLVGDLGAGKTCLTQGMARGLGIKEYAMSPSFVLVREHQGRLPLYHMDFYRLQRIEEIMDLGLDEYLYGKGVCVIEWADKGLGELPQDNLLVRIAHVSPVDRSLSLEPRGERYVELVDRLRVEIAGDREPAWNWR